MKKKGLKIGNYRITPLGIGTLLAILVIVVALIVYPRLDLSGIGAGKTNVSVNTSTPPDTDFEPETTADEAAVPTEAPTPKPTQAPTPEPQPRAATIRFLGDITIENNLLRSAVDMSTQTFDFSPMFSLIKDSVGQADYTIANVNGTLGGTVTMPSGADKMITPASLIDVLKDAGVDLIMAGGRNSMDGGLAEMQGTMTNLEIAGIQALGINATQESKGEPILQDINGIQVAFFGYTETLNTSSSDAATLDHVNLISRSTDAPSRIQAAREAGADLIIVIVDWGTRYTMDTSDSQRGIANILANAGADVIFGCGPSFVQQIAYMPSSAGEGAHQTLCIGAIGNLLSDQVNGGRNCGVILELSLAENEEGAIEISDIKCVPTYVLRYQGASAAYQYRALAIGQWLNNGDDDLLDGMSLTDLQMMEQYWNRLQQLYGNIATLEKE